jgi:hypothetical protein
MRTLASCSCALSVWLGLAILSCTANASISIVPAYVEAGLDRGNVAKSITVTNSDDTTEQYRAQVYHFIFTKDGSVEKIEPDEHSLAPWIKLNPKEFTLGPKATRVIRMAVVPPSGLSPGEYWAAIEFEPLKGVVSSGGDSGGVSIKFEVISTILVPVVGTVGKPTHQGEFRDLQATVKAGKLQLEAVLVNLGTGRLRFKGLYEIRDSKGEVVAQGAAGEATVLPGAERRFIRTVDGPFDESAEYDVQVRYTSDALEEDLAGRTTARRYVAPDTTNARH